MWENWALAQLENVQKLKDRLKDAWDIQKGSNRVSFKSDNIVLNNVFPKKLKYKLHTLCKDQKHNIQTNKQEIPNQRKTKQQKCYNWRLVVE